MNRTYIHNRILNTKTLLFFPSTGPQSSSDEKCFKGLETPNDPSRAWESLYKSFSAMFITTISHYLYRLRLRYLRLPRHQSSSVPFYRSLKRVMQEYVHGFRWLSRPQQTTEDSLHHWLTLYTLTVAVNDCGKICPFPLTFVEL